MPTVSVSDATASEEDGQISFDLTLSEAASEDVVVSYRTQAGTAESVNDFTAADAQITIAAGQTSATVVIDLSDDDVPESTETFTLEILSATGADLGDASGAGTILDTDVAPPPEPPVVSIADATRVEGNPGGATQTGQLIADGPLSTSGSQIIDADGNAVQIRAVNWFGAENAVRAPHGLWQRPMTDMMDQMVEEGFNAIRLPFSLQNILEDRQATAVGGDPSLAGLTTLEIFDRIIAYAEEIGLKIILDAHRITQGDGAEGIWYSGPYDEQDWIDGWELLATRYGDSDAVIAADLLNEPHLGTWGTGQRNDWAAAAEQAGNAVLDIAPDWLILVEGIGSYNGNNYWWGGQLQGVRDRPVELAVDNKLVYSPHDYPASVYNQPWFNDGSNLYDVFRDHWGFIVEEDIAPVLLGEFGSRLETASDRAWAQAITTYLSGDFDGDGQSDLDAGELGPSFAWWSWNPNSGDTGGILEDDWLTVRANAAELLAPLLDAEGPGDAGPRFLTFTVALDTAAPEALTLAYRTEDDSAIAGEDYVADSGTVTFAAGETTAEIRIQILTDAEGAELTATGTITNDDTAPDDGDGDGDTGGGDTGGCDTGNGFVDITTYGMFHGSSGHTSHDQLTGGRTPITTEALIAYNGLRDFLGYDDVTIEAVGTWAFANDLTNNQQVYDNDLKGVGLFYAMQGAKVGWIRDDAFDPQILADIQREARLGDAANVLTMVDAYDHDGFAQYLAANGLEDHFINTLKMEPHYGGGCTGGRMAGWSSPMGKARSAMM